MISTDYVKIETARLAKEKGFNELCFSAWKPEDGEFLLYSYPMGIDYGHTTEDYILQPTHDLLHKWLRIKYNMIVNPCDFENKADKWDFSVMNIILSEDDNLDYDSSYNNLYFPNYESAMEAGLFYALKQI